MTATVATQQRALLRVGDQPAVRGSHPDSRACSPNGSAPWISLSCRENVITGENVADGTATIENFFSTFLDDLEKQAEYMRDPVAFMRESDLPERNANDLTANLEE